MTSCRCGMPSFGFDECYWHAKSHVDWTTRPPASNGLSSEQRAFVGLFDPRPNPDGWRQPDQLSLLQPYGQEDTDEMWLSDEEQRLLQVLRDPPTAGGST
jgi:hypothetical protein